MNTYIRLFVANCIFWIVVYAILGMVDIGTIVGTLIGSALVGAIIFGVDNDGI